MVEYATPEAFLLLIPVIASAVYYFFTRSKKTGSLKFSTLSSLKEVGASWKVYLVHAPEVLKYLALILAIVALARPQRADTKVNKNIEGIDIVIALDISDSMLIEDMKPENRLEASKKVISDFIKNRESDRIGLIVFSGESFTRMPVTLDYPLLQDTLSKVETTRDMKMGTAIGVALANASARLADSDAKSKVVIFLTDGENNSGTIAPENALDIAKEYGVRIYSIGMGKDGQAQLPVIMKGPGGSKIKRYRPIHSKINEPLLRKMAEETGGKFWRAINTPSLEEVFQEIDELEKTKIEVNQYTKYAELYPPYLRWAVILVLVSVILKNVLLRKGP